MTVDQEILTRLSNIETMLSQLLGQSVASPVSLTGGNSDLIAMAMSGNREAAKAAALARARADMAKDRLAKKALKESLKQAR